MATEGAAGLHGPVFLEMGEQTAIRHGQWKLVLNGQLIEGAPPEDQVHLSNLADDMGERINLKHQLPEITAELKAAAEDWRGGIEERGTTAHPGRQSRGEFSRHPPG
jgi:arylsulfatase A-like enzyme